MQSIAIETRMPDELAATLDAHEILHDSDAILWEIESRGYHISLDGPDMSKINVSYRWTARTYTNEVDAYGYPVDREMVHGQTARITLARAFAWIVERDAKR